MAAGEPSTATTHHNGKLRSKKKSAIEMTADFPVTCRTAPIS